MTYDQLDRDKIITEWFFKDWIGDVNHLPGPKDVFIFMKIMIDVLSLLEKLDEQGRKYLVGRAAVLGVTEELLENLQTYQPNFSGDTKQVFEQFDRPHVRKTRMGIIYNLFRMLADDKKIHPQALENIRMVADKLGVTKEQAQQIQELHEEEDKLRQKRASLLFPHGFNDALVEYQKLH